MDKTTIEQVLSDNGWAFYEKCRCTGISKVKYRSKTHPELELELWSKHAQFKITYRGASTKIPLTKISQLEETLKAL